MTKHLLVSPEDVRQPGWIKFQDIPVNQYQKSVEDEKDRYSKEDFLRIYRYMRLIREFETMLYSIKTTNTYNGLEYNNPGPAHLSSDRRPPRSSGVSVDARRLYLRLTSESWRNSCQRPFGHTSDEGRGSAGRDGKLPRWRRLQSGGKSQPRPRPVGSAAGGRVFGLRCFGGNIRQRDRLS